MEGLFLIQAAASLGLTGGMTALACRKEGKGKDILLSTGTLAFLLFYSSVRKEIFAGGVGILTVFIGILAWMIWNIRPWAGKEERGEGTAEKLGYTAWVAVCQIPILVFVYGEKIMGFFHHTPGTVPIWGKILIGIALLFLAVCQLGLWIVCTEEEHPIPRTKMANVPLAVFAAGTFLYNLLTVLIYWFGSFSFADKLQILRSLVVALCAIEILWAVLSHGTIWKIRVSGKGKIEKGQMYWVEMGMVFLLVFAISLYFVGRYSNPVFSKYEADCFHMTEYGVSAALVIGALLLMPLQYEEESDGDRRWVLLLAGSFTCLVFLEKQELTPVLLPFMASMLLCAVNLNVMKQKKMLLSACLQVPYVAFKIIESVWPEAGVIGNQAMQSIVLAGWILGIFYAYTWYSRTEKNILKKDFIGLLLMWPVVMDAFLPKVVFDILRGKNGFLTNLLSAAVLIGAVSVIIWFYFYTVKDGKKVIRHITAMQWLLGVECLAAAIFLVFPKIQLELANTIKTSGYTVALILLFLIACIIVFYKTAMSRYAAAICLLSMVPVFFVTAAVPKLWVESWLLVTGLAFLVCHLMNLYIVDTYKNALNRANKKADLANRGRRDKGEKEEVHSDLIWFQNFTVTLMILFSVVHMFFQCFMGNTGSAIAEDSILLAIFLYTAVNYLAGDKAEGLGFYQKRLEYVYFYYAFYISFLIWKTTGGLRYGLFLLTILLMVGFAQAWEESKVYRVCMSGAMGAVFLGLVVLWPMFLSTWPVWILHVLKVLYLLVAAGIFIAGSEKARKKDMCFLEVLLILCMWERGSAFATSFSRGQIILFMIVAAVITMCLSVIKDMKGEYDGFFVFTVIFMMLDVLLAMILLFDTKVANWIMGLPWLFLLILAILLAIGTIVHLILWTVVVKDEKTAVISQVLFIFGTFLQLFQRHITFEQLEQGYGLFYFFSAVMMASFAAENGIPKVISIGKEYRLKREKELHRIEEENAKKERELENEMRRMSLARKREEYSQIAEKREQAAARIEELAETFRDKKKRLADMKQSIDKYEAKILVWLWDTAFVQAVDSVLGDNTVRAPWTDETPLKEMEERMDLLLSLEVQIEGYTAALQILSEESDRREDEGTGDYETRMDALIAECRKSEDSARDDCFSEIAALEEKMEEDRKAEKTYEQAGKEKAEERLKKAIEDVKKFTAENNVTEAVRDEVRTLRKNQIQYGLYMKYMSGDVQGEESIEKRLQKEQERCGKLKEKTSLMDELYGLRFKRMDWAGEDREKKYEEYCRTLEELVLHLKDFQEESSDVTSFAEEVRRGNELFARLEKQENMAFPCGMSFVAVPEGKDREKRVKIFPYIDHIYIRRGFLDIDKLKVYDDDVAVRQNMQDFMGGPSGLLLAARDKESFQLYSSRQVEVLRIDERKVLECVDGVLYRGNEYQITAAGWGTLRIKLNINGGA